MLASFAVATMVVSQESGKFTLEEFLSMRVKVSNFVIFAGLLLVWHLIFSVFGIYDSHRLSRRWEEPADILKAASAGTLAILLGAALFHIRMITVVFAVVFLGDQFADYDPEPIRHAEGAQGSAFARQELARHADRRHQREGGALCPQN